MFVLRYVLFERSARQSLAWIKEEGDIYLNTHTQEIFRSEDIDENGYSGGEHLRGDGAATSGAQLFQGESSGDEGEGELQ